MRDRLIQGLVILLMVAAAAWFAWKTEWVEVDIPRAARGEAATNNFYGLQQLVRQLGAQVARPTDMTRLPPPGATLVLTSWDWDLFPDRGQRLREWVTQGGHLVVYDTTLRNAQLKSWLPITTAPSQGKDRDDEDSGNEDTDDDDDERRAKQDEDEDDDNCHAVKEPDTVRPRYPGRQGFRLCGSWGRPLVSRQPALWALNGPRGAEVLRVALGRGSVTATSVTTLFENRWVLEGDNATIAVATLQAGPGTLVWFISEEARTPFLRWLWQQAWVALLLGAAALALALWRGAVRFGPLAPVPTPGRRSMAEQVTGTARFLRRHGAQALHEAQLRALEEAARTHVRRYSQLDRPAQAQAIAQATGLPAQALERALDRNAARSRHHRDVPAMLELLETARRLLLASQQKTATKE
jgi:hypothetical protein